MAKLFTSMAVSFQISTTEKIHRGSDAFDIEHAGEERRNGKAELVKRT